MSSSFNPSVDAARSATGATIVQQVYPDGAKGLAFSLEQVAARMRKGRLDPRVRSWAIRTLKDAGEPQGTVNQTQALLDGLRKVTMYVQDPVGSEYMQAAHETLCLDDKGFCFKGGDCDDQAVALGSATMSVGIPTFVVAQAFDNNPMPSHVLIAVQDPVTQEKYRVDPSTKLDVGGYGPFTKEWWIDPMEDKPVNLNGAAAPPDAKGDFVGVGHVGLGAGTITGAIYDSTLGQIDAAIKKLSDSVISLKSSTSTIDRVRTTLRPDAPFDPEPATTAIAGVGDFPTGGVWTASMDAVSLQLIADSENVLTVLRDGRNGARDVYLLEGSPDVFIASKQTDLACYSIVVTGITDAIMAVTLPSGTLLRGFTTLLGKLLTPSQVTTAQEAAATNQPTGLNAANLWAVAAVAAGAAAITVAGAYAFSRWCDLATTTAKEATTQTLSSTVATCLQNGTCTSTEAAAILKGNTDIRIAEAAADAEKSKHNPWSDTAKAIGDIFMWGAIGSLGVAGLMTFGPIITEAGAEYRMHAAAKREEKTRATVPTTSPAVANPRRRRARP